MSLVITTDVAEVKAGQPVTFQYELTGGTGVYPTIQYRWNYQRTGSYSSSESYTKVYKTSGTISRAWSDDMKVWVTMSAMDSDGNSVSATSQEVQVEGLKVVITPSKELIVPQTPLTMSYAISGGTEPYSVTSYWTVYIDGTSTKIRERSGSSASGGDTYSPASGNAVYYTVSVTDALGAKFSTERMVNITNNFALVFDQPAASVNAGEPVTYSYEVLNAASDVQVDCAYWTVFDTAGNISVKIPVDPAELTFPKGTVSLVPPFGDKVTFYMEVYYEGYRYSAYRALAAVAIVGGEQSSGPLKLTLTPKQDAYHFFDTIAWDYALSGWQDTFESVSAAFTLKPASGYYSYPIDTQELGGHAAGTVESTLTVPYNVYLVNQNTPLKLEISLTVKDPYGRTQTIKETVPVDDVAVIPSLKITRTIPEKPMIGQELTIEYEVIGFNSCFKGASHNLILGAGNSSWLLYDYQGLIFDLSQPTGSYTFVPEFYDSIITSVLQKQAPIELWFESIFSTIDNHSYSSYSNRLTVGYDPETGIQSDEPGGPVTIALTPDLTEMEAGFMNHIHYHVSGGTGTYRKITYQWTGPKNENVNRVLAADGVISYRPTQDGVYTLSVNAIDTEGNEAIQTQSVVVHGLQLTMSPVTTNILPGEQAAYRYEVTGGSGHYSVSCNWRYPGSSIYSAVVTSTDASGVFSLLSPEGSTGNMYCYITATDTERDISTSQKDYLSVTNDQTVSITLETNRVQAGQPITATYRALNLTEGYAVSQASWVVTDSIGGTMITNPVAFDVSVPGNTGVLTFVPQTGDTGYLTVTLSNGYSSTTYVSPAFAITGNNKVEQALSLDITPDHDALCFNQPVTFSYDISGWLNEYDTIKADWSLGYQYSSSFYSYSTLEPTMTLDSSSGKMTIIPYYTTSIVEDGKGKAINLRVTFTVTDKYGRASTLHKEFPLVDTVPEVIILTGPDAGEPLTIDIQPSKPVYEAGEIIEFSFAVRGGSGQYASLNYSYRVGSSVSSSPLYRTAGRLSFDKTDDGTHLLTITAVDTNGETVTAECPVQVNGIKIDLLSNRTAVSPGTELQVAYSITGGSGEYTVTREINHSKASYKTSDVNTDASGVLTYTPNAAGSVTFSISVTDSKGIRYNRTISVNVVTGFEVAVYYDRSSAAVGEPLTAYYELLNNTEGYQITSAYWVFSDQVGHTNYSLYLDHTKLKENQPITIIPRSFDKVYLQFGVCRPDSDTTYYFSSATIPITGGESVKDPISVRLSAPDEDLHFHHDYQFTYDISGWLNEYTSLSAEWSLVGHSTKYDSQFQVTLDTQHIVDPASSGKLTVCPCITDELHSQGIGSDLTLKCIITVTDQFGREHIEKFTFPFADIVPENIVITGENAGAPLTVALEVSETELEFGVPARFAYTVSGGTGVYTDIRACWIHDGMDYGSYSLYGAHGVLIDRLSAADTCVLVIRATDTDGNTTYAQSDKIHVNNALKLSVKPSALILQPGETLSIEYAVTGGSGPCRVTMYWWASSDTEDNLAHGEKITLDASGTFTITVPANADNIGFSISASELNSIFDNHVYYDNWIRVNSSLAIGVQSEQYNDQLNAGDVATVRYAVDGGSGKYEVLDACWYVYTLQDGQSIYAQIPVDPATLKLPEGQVSRSFTEGSSAYFYLQVRDMITGETSSGTCRSFSIVGSKDLTLPTLTVTPAETTVIAGSALPVDYALTGRNNQISKVTARWYFYVNGKKIDLYNKTISTTAPANTITLTAASSTLLQEVLTTGNLNSYVLIKATTSGGYVITQTKHIILTPGAQHKLTAGTVAPATRNANGSIKSLYCDACKKYVLPTATLYSTQTLFLPSALQVVGEEAFIGSSMQQVSIPEGVTKISPRAFADCSHLVVVDMPDSIISIADDAFGDNTNIVICCSADNGYAIGWANLHNIHVYIR